MSSNEMIYVPKEQEQPNSKPTMRVCVYRGPLKEERIKELRERYKNAGWTEEDSTVYLSFVSPCGRWFKMYNRATSQLLVVDGDWVMNLIVKGKKR